MEGAAVRYVSPDSVLPIAVYSSVSNPKVMSSQFSFDLLILLNLSHSWVVCNSSSLICTNAVTLISMNVTVKRFTLVPTVNVRFLSSYKGSLVLAVLPFSLSCCLVCFARQTSSSVRKKKNISVISHERFVFESSKYISSQNLLLTLHHHLHLSFIFLFLSLSQQESYTQPRFKNSSLSLQNTGETTTLPAV